MSKIINGPAIVIDDQREEIQPILNYLRDQGILHIYYDGQSPPINKVRGIRLAFLDIHLQAGGYDPDGKMAVSQLVSIVSEAIPANEGPIFVVFWTKHPEHAKQAANALIKKDFSVVGYCCKTKPTREFSALDVHGIFSSIEESICAKLGIVPLLLWENELKRSQSDFVKNIHSWFAPPSEIDEESDASLPLIGMYNKLLEAYCGEEIPDNHVEKWNYAISELNEIYAGEVFGSSPSLPMDIRLAEIATNRALSSEGVAKLNAAVTIAQRATGQPVNGAVYIAYDEQLKDSIIKFSKMKFIDENNCRLCYAIITPSCDLARKRKALSSTWGKCDAIYHRIVYGLIWQITDASSPQKKGQHSQSEYFDIKPFWLDDKIAQIYFNVSTISHILDCKIGGDHVFTFKPHITMDLQSKAANHVNRLGISQIE